MRVYLDMCCYNRPYDDQTQVRIAKEAQSKLHIQDLIVKGALDLVGSYILDYECSCNPFEMRRESIEGFISKNVKVYVGAERDDVIMQMAQIIMGTGVKEKDAYHVASAMYAKCDYFLTTDKRLLKFKNSRIKMINPVVFLDEMEGRS
ncbi:MAG: hypothetical protein IJ128_05580 [Firmicutes bacterium]|nr:hypothetical protein [Bacillota bacterium]